MTHSDLVKNHPLFYSYGFYGLNKGWSGWDSNPSNSAFSLCWYRSKISVENPQAGRDSATIQRARCKAQMRLSAPLPFVGVFYPIAHISGSMAVALSESEATVNSPKLARPNRCKNASVVAKRKRPSLPATFN
jgi:hypothetical protein